MLVRMNRLGIAPSNVILPVLGSGNQKIELCYIVPPLINQCIRALTDIECLQTITFCDYDDEKVRTLIAMLESAEKKEKNSDLFISYCSAQRVCGLSAQNVNRQRYPMLDGTIFNSDRFELSGRDSSGIKQYSKCIAHFIKRSRSLQMGAKRSRLCYWSKA